MGAQPLVDPVHRWIFMVYLAGDNNLEAFGLRDLQEMKLVGSSPQLAVVAQFDCMSDRITRRYKLREGGDLAADLVAELPETNTGDPKNLVDFFTWACDQYPAERTALILWNHGSGWKDDDIYKAVQRSRPGVEIQYGQARGLAAGRRCRSLFRRSLEHLLVEATQRAILFDDTSADFLDNQEMSRALQAAVAHSGRQIDLIGFDACLMNMLEVGYQVKDTCRVMVGSQEVEPGDGWPYTAILNHLRQAPELSAETLGRQIVEEYAAYYRGLQSSSPVTQSALKLGEISRLGAAVQRLGSCLSTGLEQRDVLGGIFTALRRAQSFRDADYLDLANFCELLLQTFEGGQSAAQASITAAAQNVLAGFSGEQSLLLAEAHHGPEVQYARGLSIYLPVRSLSPLYNTLNFAREAGWKEFLEAMVNPG